MPNFPTVVLDPRAAEGSLATVPAQLDEAVWEAVRNTATAHGSGGRSSSSWVILLAPVFALLWIKLGSKQPSSPLKFVIGLLCVSLSFALMVPAAKLTADGKVGPLWLVSLFFLQTCGELLLSPVGLSTMTKLAPARLVGVVMGIWFLAAALGNKLAGVLAGEFKSEDAAGLSTFFWQQALSVGAATLVLFALVPWVKKLMGGVR